MPPRVHISQTVALCGIRSDVTSENIKKVLEAERLVPAYLEAHGIAKLLKDKHDTDQARRLVFLNCKSKDDAQKVCKVLNRKKVDLLGMNKYGYELQAVLKSGLPSVIWKTKTVTKTIEGSIATKRNIDCFIDHPMR